MSGEEYECCCQKREKSMPLEEDKKYILFFAPRKTNIVINKNIKYI
jgi:hypothetical protein